MLGTTEPSKQEQLVLTPEEDLPEVANTVKQWLHDHQNTNLVLKRHQEVLSQRGGGLTKTYKGKKSIDPNFPRQMRVEMNRRHAAGTSKSTYASA